MTYSKKCGLIIFLIFNLAFCVISKKEKSKYIHSLALNDSVPVVEVYARPADLNLAPSAKLRLLVDTGSNISFLTKNFLPGYGRKESIPTKIVNGSKDLEVEILFVELMDSARNSIGFSDFYLFSFKDGFPYDGVIGNDMLSRYKVYLDFPDNIHLASKSQKIPKGFTESEIIVAHTNHLVTKVKLNEKTILLLLDTGAGLSFLNEEDIEEIGLKKISNKEYYNFTGEIQEGATFEAAKLCLNDKHCEANIEILGGMSLKNFFGINGMQISGLLGMNWMKKYKIWIDYSQKKIYVQKPKRFFWNKS